MLFPNDACGSMDCQPISITERVTPDRAVISVDVSAIHLSEELQKRLYHLTSIYAS